MLRLYILFAIVATLVNLAVQKLSLLVYEQDYSLYVAMFFGTVSGLVLKYVLDKRFVFSHKSNNLQQEGNTFTLYSLMGVFTTFIFWGVEIGFDYFFDFESAKFIGAIVGLSIGYTVKFYLDSAFVFK